jgi:hypothetical protein
MRNLERMLWDAVTGKRKSLCNPEEIQQQSTCWINAADGSFGMRRRKVKIVPMQDWLRLYEANRRRRPNKNECGSWVKTGSTGPVCNVVVER